MNENYLNFIFKKYLIIIYIFYKFNMLENNSFNKIFKNFILIIN